MITSIHFAVCNAKTAVHGWFRRVFKDQAGGAEVIATLIIIAVVLVLALTFRTQLTNLVKSLWDTMVKDREDVPSISPWT